MFSWEWENFTELIKACGPIVDDHGPLAGPIHRLTMQRSTDLRIVMETEASASAQEPQCQDQPGTVRINDDRITFSTSVGLEVEAIGVSATNIIRRFEGIAPGVTTQKVNIHRLVGRFQQAQQPQYAIDWLENVSSDFLWPDNIESIDTQTTAVTLGGLPSTRPKLTMTGSSSPHGSSWAAAQIEVDGCRLYLCKYQRLTPTEARKPGFIVYEGIPTDQFRDRIRRSLSFSMGTYLIYLGVSRFDKEWDLTDFEAISPYTMRGHAVALPPQPPSPLGSRSLLDIDAAKLSRMVNAIYRKYDELNFGVVSWAYWHAVTATSHIAAVHFGAALESLQRAYLSSSATKVASGIANDSTWSQVRTELEVALVNLGLPSAIFEQYKNKIGGLNSRSQHSVGKDLIDVLGLTLSKREKNAHDARHSSAHGKDDEITAEWIRDLKLLRIRFHRILLAMTAANDEYYDYFTIGGPMIRRVEEPVPDDR